VNPCPMLSHCRFFSSKLRSMPVTADLAKDHYCRGQYTECARHIVRQALGPAADVPEDLYPSDVDRAQMILETARR
jgi:hypothetical protein